MAPVSRFHSRIGLGFLLLAVWLCGAVLLTPEKASADSDDVHAMHGDGSSSAALFSLPGGADAPVQWIESFFFGATAPDKEDFLAASGNANQAGFVQSGLQSLLRLYSYAMLTCASFLLLFYLLRIIAETAHTGRPGGRANQLWGPIRAVLAIGLLVPLPSGLNSGQMVIYTLTRQGSALASNAWHQFIGAYTGAFSGEGILVPGGASDQASFVDSLFLTEVCINAYNYKVGNDGGNYLVTPNDRTLQDPPENGAIRKATVFLNPASTAYCGTIRTYEMAGAGASISHTMTAAAVNGGDVALTGAMQGVQALACKFVQHTMTGPGWSSCPAPIDANGATIKPDGLPHITSDDLAAIARTYNTAIEGSLAGVYGRAAEEVEGNLSTQSGDLGWLAAGSLFLSLSRLEHLIVNASQYTAHIAMPQIMLPETGLGTAQVSLREATLDAVDQAETIIIGQGGKTGFDLSAPAIGGGDGDTATPGLSPTVLHGIMSGEDDGVTSGDLQDFTGTIVGSISRHVGHDSILLSAPPSHGLPLLVLQRLGWDCLRAAVAVYGIGGFTGIFTAGISSVLLLFGTLFFCVGVLLAYFLPLLPFVRFMFAVFGWLLSFAEAMVALPLFALAHLDPEGEGVLPQQTRTGYILLLGLFFQPILIVIGLIVALLLMNGFYDFLNVIWWPIVIGIATPEQSGQALITSADSIDAFSMLVYGLLYGLLAYTICNVCFKAISAVPDRTLRWLGTRAPISVTAEAMLGKGSGAGEGGIVPHQGGNLLAGAATLTSGLVHTQSQLAGAQGANGGRRDSSNRAQLMGDSYAGKADVRAASGDIGNGRLLTGDVAGQQSGKTADAPAHDRGDGGIAGAAALHGNDNSGKEPRRLSQTDAANTRGNEKSLRDKKDLRDRGDEREESRPDLHRKRPDEDALYEDEREDPSPGPAESEPGSH